MKSFRIALVLSGLFLVFQFLNANCEGDQTKNKPKIEFLIKESEQKIDVMVGGIAVTSYCWPGNVYKPVLYPVRTLNGAEITRGFPLKPREGERNDHIHQVGMWLNYGNVNGFDFWGNGSTGKKSENGGVVKHMGIDRVSGDEGEGILAISASWQDPDGRELLIEKTEYHFIVEDKNLIIDRITTLSATGQDVTFDDTKEGMFAIRVARQLELPSGDKAFLLDKSGNQGTEQALENRGVTGNYFSSEGVSSEEVWGTRARWMHLSGKIGSEKISIVICDHPGNPGYPTYWHARGYGLFASNPLGGKDFTNGKDSVNFSIHAGKSATFRYRTVIAGTLLVTGEINDFADNFADSYK